MQPTVSLAKVSTLLHKLGLYSPPQISPAQILCNLWSSEDGGHQLWEAGLSFIFLLLTITQKAGDHYLVSTSEPLIWKKQQQTGFTTKPCLQKSSCHRQAT